MPKTYTWREAIKIVLREAGGAMHYKEIAERIVSNNMTKTVGATPAVTVSSSFAASINGEGERSPFLRIGRGEYILREHFRSDKSNKEPSLPKVDGNNLAEEQYSVVSSFGMYWSRDLVAWTRSPNILGMQQIGAASVDFREQMGIYLLYDGREVIYVGRSTDRPLGTRLYEHTVDRLSTRWDRFSWFGLLPVSDDGSLQKLPDEYSANIIIPAFEAVLIEALEPRQNRKRGDDLAAVEYIQKEDPEVERKKKQALLKEALDKV